LSKNRILIWQFLAERYAKICASRRKKFAEKLEERLSGVSKKFEQLIFAN
jgi:hypothetical protein